MLVAERPQVRSGWAGIRRSFDAGWCCSRSRNYEAFQLSANPKTPFVFAGRESFGTIQIDLMQVLVAYGVAVDHVVVGSTVSDEFCL